MTPTCSGTSREHGERLTATASRVARWLLVEHRGAWGPQSVPTSRMPVAAARALEATARAWGARLLVVRRPAGVDCPPGRRVFAVESRPGLERVRTRTVVEDRELLDLDPAGDGWSDSAEPLYLVCTHGRHDRCCALRGRPVAQALSRRWPERTWEVSHVGGDRFAANVVVLPEGLYLGQVPAEDAVDVVERLEAGLLPPQLVRGRSSLPLPTQAAQAFAREALDCWGRRDLTLVQQADAGTDTWRVRLGGPDVDVVVQYDRAGDGVRRMLTCGGPEDKLVPQFRLVSLEPV